MLKLSKLKNGLKNVRKKFRKKKEVMMEPEKKEVKPEFKKVLIGLDFINSRPEAERPKLIAEIRLMAIAMTNPRMEYEEIIALPMDVFLTYLLAYRKSYENMYKKIAGANSEQKSGIQFAREEDYVKIASGKSEGGIRFSTVKK